MSELYARVLLWHKLVATVTGGLALCSAKRKLPREETERWIELLGNVSAEMGEVLAGRPFIIDDKGQLMSDGDTVRMHRFFNREGDVDVAATIPNATSTGAVSPTKTGGPRLARRKNAPPA